MIWFLWLVLSPLPPPESARHQTKLQKDQRLLVVGDSHLGGALGPALHAKLRERGVRVHVVALNGATAIHFLEGKPNGLSLLEIRPDGTTKRQENPSHCPRLETLLRQDKPQCVVVVLGENMRGISTVEVESQVQRVAQPVRRLAATLVWVGPPPKRRDFRYPKALQEFDQVLAAKVKPVGTYLTSRSFFQAYSGTDGVHYNDARGIQMVKAWATYISGLI